VFWRRQLLVLRHPSGVLRLIVVRVGAAPVAGEIVLLEGEQVVQHLHSPLEGAVELVDQLGEPQVEAVVTRGGAARFDGPVEEVASQMAAEMIRKGLDHLTVSCGLIFTLLLLPAAIENVGKLYKIPFTTCLIIS